MERRETESAERFLKAHAHQRTPRPRGWFAWQYVGNPDGFDVRVCRDGDSIAGISGFIPCRLEIDGVVRTGAFSTNTVVAPPYRRQGLGRALHETRLRDYDCALSSGQSADNRRLYEQLGFVVCGDYRRVFVQTTLPTFRFRAQTLSEWRSWLFWRFWARRRARAGRAVRVEVERRAPPDDPTLYGPRFDGLAVGPRWERSHVVWRYERHPYFTHQFASVFDGENRLGFAVVRKCQAATVLVDLYGKPANLPLVLRGIADRFRGLITGVFVGSPLDRMFRREGWLTFRAGGQLMGKSNDPALHRRLSERAWCFFAGDSDSDR
jgi:GNAT superfamily N-acetyltransferase|tara:strand:- start:67 stop:1032 length:966 start_codon:yes stop_codon:yes gene_type:complete